MLKGTGVSSGYGIGKAVIIADEILDYSSVIYIDAATQKKRLENAVNDFSEKTLSLKDNLSKTAGLKEAEILEGHIQMIRDPFMMSQMNDLIDSGSVAEDAVEKVCNMFIDMFSATDDDLTRQRASDIRDIRDDILRTLLNIDCVDIQKVPKGSVLIAKDFTPSMTGKINKDNVAAIIAEVGSYTSHSAILARAMGIPAVLSLKGATETIKDNDSVIVDGFKGKVFVSPTSDQLAEYKAKQKEYEAEKEGLLRYCNLKTVTKNNVEKQVYGNIGKPEDVQAVIQNGGEGIGLFRTEFLYMGRNDEPSEDEQFEAYSTVAKAMGSKEVIIRTLDIGGDKEISYLHIEKEDNPFLGHRAIRYCLDNPELYKRQLRAILRASQYGNLKIMLPMITCSEEITAAKKIISECISELNSECMGVKAIPVGIMVETPSAAIISDELAEISDFFSIGTNDLTGYIMAVDRGNESVSNLYDTMQPAVLRAIEMTIKNAKKNGIPVGMCGEGAADERLIPHLLKWGLDEFSVSASSILKTRKLISENNA